MDINQAESCPGTVGLLFDDTPPLTAASVRPYAWSNLLYRGATRPSEVVAAVALVCSPEDLKVANWDDADEDEYRSWAEVCAEEVLGDMLAAGLCRYNEELDLWVLTAGENKKNVSKVIGAVTSLDAQMPKHLLVEIAQ
jgi:hypothetical protein